MKIFLSLIIWAYLKEAILTICCYLFIFVLVGFEPVVKFIQPLVWELSAIGGLVLGMDIAFWIYFGQGLESEFGKYLLWSKSDIPYMKAYQWQCILSLFAVILPIGMKFIKATWFPHFICLFFIYVFINAITVIGNTFQIMRLKQKFQFEYDREKESFDQDNVV